MGNFYYIRKTFKKGKYMLDMNNKIADEVTLLKIDKSNKTVELKEKIYEELFKNLLHIKECLNEHHKDYKNNDGKFIEFRPDVMRICYSYGAKFLENLQKHISIGNLGNKYKNHTSVLKQCLLQLDKDLDDADYSGYWGGENNFVHLIEPTDKLIEMMKYDFGFNV